MKVVIVAANTFEYDARQLRTARALAADGHAVSLVGFAAPGLPDHERLEGGIDLRRVTIDRTIASAFRPLPRPARGVIARLIGIDPDAIVLLPTRATGLDRLRAPVRRAAEIVAHVRRVGPWSRAVAGAVPDADVVTCKALIALPVIREVARRTGARYVYDIADIHTEAARLARMPGWFRVLVRRRERQLMRGAIALTAVSPGVADEVARRFGVDRPTVVLNTPPAWRPDEELPDRTGRLREVAAIPADADVVLYQGGFSVDRGIEELVEAVESPVLSGRRIAVVFVGYGRLRSWLDEQAARLPGRIAVVDAIPPSELLEYTVDADIGFVGQPPRTLNQRLNLANKWFEYLQAGVPVIVAEGTAHCGLTREHAVGLCADVDDPEAIPMAIERLLSGSPADRHERRLRARRIATERYTWEIQSSSVIELYRRLDLHRPADRSA